MEKKRSDEKASHHSSGKNEDISDFATDLLSRNGALFRTKLIENLKPSLHYTSSHSLCKYITKDITQGGGLLMDRIMSDSPYALVGFTAWTNQHHIRLGVTKLDRRKNRTLIKHKAKKLLEEDLMDFVHFVLHNAVFWAITIVAGLTNIVSQVCWDMFFNTLATEIPTNQHTLVIFYAIVFMDHMVFFVFLIEVILWCYYDWKHYVRSYNFWVTVVALISIGYMATLLLCNGVFWLAIHGDHQDVSIWSLQSQQQIISLCQSCRLILCSRIMLMFKQSEIILLAVIQALPSLIYVSIMTALTTILYWHVGMKYFVDDEKGLEPVFTKYTELGLGEGQALLLFLLRVFTFDHFLGDVKAGIRIHGGWSALYIISWMIISNYIFANLFAAVLINNFGMVRKKLTEQYHKMQEINTRIEYIKELGDQLKESANEFKRVRMFDLRRSLKPRDAKELSDIETDDGSEVIQTINRLESDQEVPYVIRSKMRVHNPPVFDIKTYLQTWPLSTADVEINVESASAGNGITSSDGSRTSRGNKSRRRSNSEVSSGTRKKSIKLEGNNKNRNAKESKSKSSTQRRSNTRKHSGKKYKHSGTKNLAQSKKKHGKPAPTIKVSESAVHLNADYLSSFKEYHNSLSIPRHSYAQQTEAGQSGGNVKEFQKSHLEVVDGSLDSDITVDLKKLVM